MHAARVRRVAVAGLSLADELRRHLSGPPRDQRDSQAAESGRAWHSATLQ